MNTSPLLPVFSRPLPPLPAAVVDGSQKRPKIMTGESLFSFPIRYSTPPSDSRVLTLLAEGREQEEAERGSRGSRQPPPRRARPVLREIRERVSPH
ncbi:unnamed protein product [Calypogeia fissa]